jgi:hypothetical protein
MHSEKQKQANPAWSRQRLSALVVSRLFGFVGILVQRIGSVNPALRLTHAIMWRDVATLQQGLELIEGYKE